MIHPPRAAIRAGIRLGSRGTRICNMYCSTGTNELTFCFFLSDTFTCPISGPLIPLFWISGDVSSGFQNQSGFCLIHIAEANVMN